MSPSRKSEDHLDLGETLAVAEGERPSARVRTHLEHCGRCRAVLEEQEAMVTAMRRDRSPEPPESLVRRAVALFPARPSFARGILTTLARLVRGPEALALAPAGLRGAAGVAPRLLFEGLGYEVDVEVESLPEGLRVTGQVLPRAQRPLPLMVWAEQGGRSAAEAAVGEHGGFVLEHLAAGPFDLLLDLGENRLKLPVRAEV